MRKACPHCHQSNPSWAKFCQNCGTVLVQDNAALPRTELSQFAITPKKCENNSCQALIDSRSLQCPYCATLQIKPHVADVIAARIINLVLGITIFSFFLEAAFSQSAFDNYGVLNLYTFILLNEQSIKTTFYTILALFFIFTTLLIGQLMTKGQNVGFETLQIQLLEKKSKEPVISNINDLKNLQMKKTILWAIIETIDSWSLFSLSLLTYALAILLMRDSSSIFISDRMVKGVLVDKQKLEKIEKTTNNLLTESKTIA